MAVSIRECRPDDIDELWRLDQECFAPGIAYSRQEFAHYMKLRDSFAIVADDGAGYVVGFAIGESRLVRTRSDPAVRIRSGHVITLDVRQQARRGGIGSLLMNALEDRFRLAGCQTVYLETAVNNRAAISLYRRRGYSVLNTIPRYYEGKLNALVMGKRLADVPRETTKGV
jgi:ribosomal-protein-alanine N-acetyltransferase